MRETKAQKRQWLIERLEKLGFNYGEIQTLRRIEMTLHRWSEHECNGNIQREGDDDEGKPRWFSTYAIENQSSPKGFRIADRERGALKRLAKLMSAKPDLVYYHQGDPRGCALYVGFKSDIGDRSIDSCYSRLVAVCD